MTQDQPISEQDVADLEAMYSEDVPQNSLFKVWREIATNFEPSSKEPIPANVAHKIVVSWPKLTYQDTAVYHKLYHSYLMALIPPLDEVIAKHPEALEYHGAEDGEKNHDLYLNLLVEWHLTFDRVEESWRAEDIESHIQLAALIDARAFVFGATGFAGHLDSIQFQLSDVEFMAALEAAKAKEDQ